MESLISELKQENGRRVEFRQLVGTDTREQQGVNNFLTVMSHDKDGSECVECVVRCCC